MEKSECIWCHTHRHTQTRTRTHTFLTWRVYICLSGNILLFTKWHCSAYSAIHHSSHLHLTNCMMCCEEDTIFKHIINETLSRSQKFKKRQVFSLKCQPVFLGEMWLSVWIMFSVVNSRFPTAAILPSILSAAAFRVLSPLLTSCSSTELRTRYIPALEIGPRCQQPHPVG